jgi:hypothetical protein
VRLFMVNAVLLVAVGLAVVGSSVFSRPAIAVEGVVRRYAAALTSGDVDGALAEIAPEERDGSRAWLASQAGNVYEVRGIAVRAVRGTPSEVTVVLDVNRGYVDEYYQPTTTEPVEQVDGVWYLARPLLVEQLAISN